eukprot:TRINITY_DN68498_c0_g1_i1.p1 TRINITY_DN68498_c0_g1~~TRINITY_DN68498_c0_g1_i1.p1  ORF type:complete len:349 (+),score=18.38 TRINITY_DN68498_c0_g1_i1:29-1075(+)
MAWPKCRRRFDRRHYYILLLVAVVFFVLPVCVTLISRQSLPDIKIPCCLIIVNALSFASCAWIVIFLPSLRPGYAERLLPKQVFLISCIGVFEYVTLTIQDVIEFGGVFASVADVALACKFTMPAVLLFRNMSALLNAHITIGFVCFGLGLECLLSPMDKSLRAVIPLGILSAIIEMWLSGDIGAVHAGSERSLFRIKCTFIRLDEYGAVVVFIGAFVAVAAFLVLLLRAITRREDFVANSLCWRVAPYLLTFLVTLLMAAVVTVGDKRQDAYIVAIILQHCNGWLIVFTYSVQSKICQTSRTELALPQNSTIEAESFRRLGVDHVMDSFASSTQFQIESFRGSSFVG